MKNKILPLLLSAALTLGCAVPAFAAEDGLPASDAPAAAEAAESGLWITAEAAQALAVLGYSSQEVSAALKGVDVDSLPLEEIIRQSLKKMVK